MSTYRYQVGLAWAGSGSPGVNTFHFRQDGDVLETPLQSVIDTIKAFYQGITTILPTGMTITGPAEVIKDPYGAPEYAAVTGWSVTGNGGATYMPLASAMTVTWRTTSATRSGRGRTFIGPLSTQCLDADGTPKAAQRTLLLNAATTFLNESESWAAASMGVYSPTDGVLRDWVSCNVRDTFAVLRSRRD